MCAFMSRSPLFAALAIVASSAVSWPDCNGTGESDLGPFGPLTFHNITWNNKIFYVVVPQGRPGPWPVLIFMHGWTGAWEQFAFPDFQNGKGHGPNASTWYARPLDIYASHGFIVIFPHVIGPVADRNHSTTDIDGTTIFKTLDYLKDAQVAASSPLKGLLDLNTISLAGHSMGSGDVLRVGQNLTSGLKFLGVQHPSNFIMDGLKDANKFPMLITTSTNDAAFFPAPDTAARVVEAYKDANLTGPAALLQLSAAACGETNKSLPWAEAGHDCSFKPDVETPWILRGLKVYAHFGGSSSNRCANMLWGSGADSASKDPSMDKVILTRGGELMIV